MAITAEQAAHILTLAGAYGDASFEYGSSDAPSGSARDEELIDGENASWSAFRDALAALTEASKPKQCGVKSQNLDHDYYCGLNVHDDATPHSEWVEYNTNN